MNLGAIAVNTFKLEVTQVVRLMLGTNLIWSSSIPGPSIVNDDFALNEESSEGITYA